MLMRLPGVYNGTKKYNLPEAYKHIIDKNDYKFVIDTAIKYHHEKNLPVLKIDEGEIVTEVNGAKQHRYLDNLVRMLAAEEISEWKKIIYSHFDKLKNNKSAYNYLFKDFDYAAQFLRVLIKAESFDFGGKINDFIWRSDFPYTNTFLVLKFEEQFKYLRYEDILEWDTSITKLFETAIANISTKEVEVKQYEYCHKFPVYVFSSGDYSSSMMLDLQKRAGFSIGSYGSLISIPSKGTAFAHPIETSDIMALVKKLNPVIEQFHKEEPGSITTNFYWLYNGNFEVFPTEKNGGHLFIRLPDALIQIFKA